LKVSSNRIADLLRHYELLLNEQYNRQESKQLIRHLIAHFAEIPASLISLHLDKRISESQLLLIHFGVKDLLKQRPLQYIIGEAEFLDFTVSVNEDVLIPRPETEEMVIKIQEKIIDKPTVLDIGTGSGCIAIAMAKWQNSEVKAVDISPKALTIAKNNAIKNKVEIDFVAMSILEEDQWPKIAQTYDLIISNPPYVRELEKEKMADNVLKYEPELALFVADSDPLVFYKQIAKFAHQQLKRNGTLWLEINEYLDLEMEKLLKHYFVEVSIIEDFRGRKRFCKAQNQLLKP
jgi:release factor glutamine methyltransferase